MRIALAAFIAFHGLIHLLGPAKAFRWADVSRLRASVTPEAGLLWFLAAVLLIAAAIGLVLGAPWRWYPALPGVLLSQGMIMTAWSDAKCGTVPAEKLVRPFSNVESGTVQKVVAVSYAET